MITCLRVIGILYLGFIMHAHGLDRLPMQIIVPYNTIFLVVLELSHTINRSDFYLDNISVLSLYKEIGNDYSHKDW